MMVCYAITSIQALLVLVLLCQCCDVSTYGTATRTSKMTLQQDVTIIIGSLTGNLSNISRLTCQSQCLSRNCFYMAVNKTSKSCSIYGNGKTIYNVNGLQVYSSEQQKCNNTVCNVHGQCYLSLVGGFDCYCLPGYTGSLCENACGNNPCLLGNACPSGNNKYSANNTSSSALTAFFATTTSPMTSKDPFVFSSVLVNNGSGFNTNTMSSFTPVQSGLYWFFVTIVSYGESTSHIGITNTDICLPPTIIISNNTACRGLTAITRDFIRYVTPDTELKVMSLSNTSTSNDIGSSWGGFYLDNLMDSLVVFEVYCSTKFSDVNFDIVNINIGNGWSPSSKCFVAPVTGAYYFSYSFGTIAANQLWYHMRISNNNTKFCDFELAPDDKPSKINGPDVGSRGCLISLNAGISVYVTSVNNYANAMSSYGETSFRGFLYSPKQGISAAWSVCSNAGELTVSGLLQFEVVYVNTGVWSPLSNSVTITTAGTYYVEIGSQNYYGGNTDMQLIANGNRVILRLVISQSYCSFIIRSRSSVVQLIPGDVLTVLCTSCDMSGDNAGGIYFQGILLMAY